MENISVRAAEQCGGLSSGCLPSGGKMPAAPPPLSCLICTQVCSHTGAHACSVTYTHVSHVHVFPPPSHSYTFILNHIYAHTCMHAHSYAHTFMCSDIHTPTPLHTHTFPCALTHTSMPAKAHTHTSSGSDTYPCTHSETLT